VCIGVRSAAQSFDIRVADVANIALGCGPSGNRRIDRHASLLALWRYRVRIETGPETSVTELYASAIFCQIGAAGDGELIDGVGVAQGLRGRSADAANRNR